MTRRFLFLTTLALGAAATDAPRLLAPGVISTRDYERDGSFAPDGRSFYFTKRTMWPFFSAICVSYLRAGRWSEPEVASFSGQYPDATPAVSPDGKQLYFASRRPVDGAEKRDYDIWVVDWTGAGWGPPRRLPAPVNGPGNELSPSVTLTGALYFVSDGVSPHVVRSVRLGDGWLAPVVVGDSGTDATAEVSAGVDPSERYLVVTVVGRDDALHSAEGVYPRTDLYLRERRDGAWSPLRHLPAPVNSAADDGSPMFTPDGKSLVFTSERGRLTEHGGAPLSFTALERTLHEPGNGLGDIYLVSRRALGITP